VQAHPSIVPPRVLRRIREFTRRESRVAEPRILLSRRV